MSTPTDWVQFYPNSSHLAPPGRATSSTQSPDAAVGTTSSSPPAGAAAGAAATHGGGAHLTPEGRVAKPIRRRSRASRRTPTTLLNTDTSNFRAMVQQFTGGPSAPFAGGNQHHHGAVPGFAFGQRVNPSTAVMVQPSMYHLQYHHQPQQQPQQPQYQHQNYMFTLNNSSNTNNNTAVASGGGGGAGGGDMFFQRLSSSRAPTMEVSNGYVMDVGSRQAASSSSNENNRSNSYIFWEGHKEEKKKQKTPKKKKKKELGTDLS